MIQTPVKPAKQSGYWEKFDQFQKLRAGREPAWLTALRKAGVARFAETGYPTVQDEDWRFTNVASLAKQPFHPHLSATSAAASRDWLEGLTFAKVESTRLVFVDGHFASALSSVGSHGAKVRIGSLAAALEQEPGLLEGFLGRHAQDATNPFAALNLAFFTDGALIFIPDGIELPHPVQIVHLQASAEPGATSHLRHLIVAGAGSKGTVVETYVGRDRGSE